MAEYARANVTAVTTTFTPQHVEYVVTLDRDLVGALVGDLIGNLTRSSGTFVVRRNKFHDHRARGMLIQSPNGLVEDNTVSNVTMAGLHVTTDSNFFIESIGANNLLVRRNVFTGVNYGSPELSSHGRHMAAINVVGDTTTGLLSTAVHRNITIEDNIVEDTPGLAMLVASADHVVVRNNTIIRSNQLSFASLRTGADIDAAARGSVMITRASNVTVTGNRQLLSDDMFDSGVYVDPRNTIAITVGNNTLEHPAFATSNLLASVSGTVVDLAWHNPTAAQQSVLLEAFSTSGALLASITLNGNAETFSAAAPPNTYHVRVFAGLGGGIGPSNTVPVTVPGACVPPAVPRALNAVVAGQAVSVSWMLPPIGTAAPTGYILSAGFAPGASNAAVFPTTLRGVQAVAPRGTYYARVRAINRCGQSADTADIQVIVP